MGFNYAKEKARFDRNWSKLRQKYEAAGMEAAAIQSIYDYDWQYFCSQRIYRIHTQPFPSETIQTDMNSENTHLLQKFDTLSVSFDKENLPGRFAWVDTISDPRLVQRLKQLSMQDLELLTLYAMEGYSQTEIAHIQECNQSVISRKLRRIKNFLK